MNRTVNITIDNDIGLLNIGRMLSYLLKTRKRNLLFGLNFAYRTRVVVFPVP